MISSSIATKNATGMDVPSVLGNRPLQIPISGTIRPGIKVLTKVAAQNQVAQQIYAAGIAEGRDNADLEKAIMDACKFDRSPLTPKNVPYFTARRGDFSVPDVADIINAIYSEDRGEGTHLYRLPIIFPVDAWQIAMPHALQVFTRNERLYWSEYTPAGVRVCQMHAPLKLDPKNKRAARPFGGRRVTLRPENNGICDPDICQQWQSGECKLSGRLIFYIPGVPGAGAIELPMTSYYAMAGIREQLELMVQIRGRISGTERGRPIFYLTKRHDQISRLNLETGKAEKVRQWIVVLESDMDMAGMFLTSDPSDRHGIGSDAVVALEGAIDIESKVDEPHAQEAGVDGVETPSVEELRKIASAGWHKLKITTAEFKAYAIGKWGAGWSTDAELLSRVIEELDGVQDEAAYGKMVREKGGAK